MESLKLTRVVLILNGLWSYVKNITWILEKCFSPASCKKSCLRAATDGSAGITPHLRMATGCQQTGPGLCVLLFDGVALCLCLC